MKASLFQEGLGGIQTIFVYEKWYKSRTFILSHYLCPANSIYKLKENLLLVTSIAIVFRFSTFSPRTGSLTLPSGNPCQQRIPEGSCARPRRGSFTIFYTKKTDQANPPISGFTVKIKQFSPEVKSKNLLFLNFASFFSKKRFHTLRVKLRTSLYFLLQLPKPAPHLFQTPTSYQ